MTYETVLEAYSLEEIIELNDISQEETLEYLVTQGFLKLPDLKPLDFE